VGSGRGDDDMTLEDGGDSIDFSMGAEESTAGAEAGAESAGAEMGEMGPPDDRPAWVRMLRSTEPPVTPQEVGRELSLEAEWHEHILCGLVKASGSEGTEAWMNMLMGVVLLTLDYSGADSEEEAGEGDPQEDLHAQEGVSGPETFDGPQ